MGSYFSNVINQQLPEFNWCPEIAATSVFFVSESSVIGLVKDRIACNVFAGGPFPLEFKVRCDILLIDEPTWNGMN